MVSPPFSLFIAIHQLNCILDMLMQHLEIATIHELEDLIIEAFYADLLTGRLDQRLSRLSVDSVAGRDVNALDEIAKGLAAWNAKIGSAVEMLDSKIAQRRQYECVLSICHL